LPLTKRPEDEKSDDSGLFLIKKHTFLIKKHTFLIKKHTFLIKKHTPSGVKRGLALKGGWR